MPKYATLSFYFEDKNRLFSVFAIAAAANFTLASGAKANVANISTARERNRFTGVSVRVTASHLIHFDVKHSTISTSVNLPLFSHERHRSSVPARPQIQPVSGSSRFPVHTPANSAPSSWSSASCQLTRRPYAQRSALTGKGAAGTMCKPHPGLVMISSTVSCLFHRSLFAFMSLILHEEAQTRDRSPVLEHTQDYAGVYPAGSNSGIHY